MLQACLWTTWKQIPSWSTNEIRVLSPPECTEHQWELSMLQACLWTNGKKNEFLHEAPIRIEYCSRRNVQSTNESWVCCRVDCELPGNEFPHEAPMRFEYCSRRNVQSTSQSWVCCRLVCELLGANGPNGWSRQRSSVPPSVLLRQVRKALCSKVK
jgi:hypothetical protein